MNAREIPTPRRRALRRFLCYFSVSQRSRGFNKSLIPGRSRLSYSPTRPSSRTQERTGCVSHTLHRQTHRSHYSSAHQNRPLGEPFLPAGAGPVSRSALSERKRQPAWGPPSAWRRHPALNPQEALRPPFPTAGMNG
ncbi:hypothetical protein SKAU_G00187970 [Synaphobranchus kaupii]|uniref:Uncharacterized protein n=1 Tax=Synaphobranchus kaupii TaxID=118154 RepID=A0A9Q1IWY9_SYNKA|nr:hypothetical protein SKAU_G00187970 [Synaphobranchus kaupii]